MPDAELVSLIYQINTLKQTKRTQARSIVSLHFSCPNQGPYPMTQDGVADSNGASISVANVVSSAAVATDAAAATVTVTKSEGNMGEGKLSIVTEG